MSDSRSRVEVTARLTTSTLSRSSFEIRGGSASSGSSSRSSSSAARRSLAASSTSVPRAKSRRTRLDPSSESEVTRSRLGSPETAFSIGSVMICSISCGPTFG